MSERAELHTQQKLSGVPDVDGEMMESKHVSDKKGLWGNIIMCFCSHRPVR